ncbi:hypothetical protein [Leucobacter sp. M11]|uniref:hypothetical protein n=1 Tax=Leucobacter sp. M11 TaxID=2993565 RepID=UPI002D7E8681|nr:hypothetical protein [Leucobacter sp. M11]MEB4615848.1 hypothetical protein [Leucobacter sp. M11]
MCQYQSTCPTTRHRPGTQCPVRVSIEKHNRKVHEQNIRLLWTLVFVVAVLAIGLGLYWFFLRDGALGIGIPAIDNLLMQ